VVTASQQDSGIPPSFSDGWKRIFLGKPLTSEQLESERLSNPVALGAISPDAISSTAYGPEQVMVELLPRAGMGLRDSNGGPNRVSFMAYVPRGLSARASACYWLPAARRRGP